MILRKYPRATLSALALCLFAAASMLVSPAASGQMASRASEEIGHVLASFETVTLDPAEVLRDVREDGAVTLQTARGAFDLEVTPYDVRTADYRAVAVGEGGVTTELPRTPSNSWRGRVRGQKDSVVRLYLDGRRVQGVIVTSGQTFFIEPARDLSTAAGSKDFVFYEAANVNPVDASCEEVSLGGKVAAEAVRSASAASSPRIGEAFAPLMEARVAAEADFEFYQLNGSNVTATVNDIAAVMTAVDGIYERDLGVSVFRLADTRVWTANNDPYTLTDATAALEEFADEYEGSFGTNGNPPARELTHLFTGKDLEGTTIGIAFTAALCNSPNSSYGISQSRFSTIQALRVAVTAHELGHNFGATHTGPSSNPADPPAQIPSCDQPGQALMQPGVGSNATGFCQFSRDQITYHLLGTGGSCMSRIQNGCNYALSSSSGFFPAGGGTGSVNVTTGAGCAWDIAEPAPWISQGTSGTGSGTASFNVAANPGGPRSVRVDIGGQSFTIKQAGTPACLAGATQINFGQTLNGSLAASDCSAASPSGEPERTGAFTDLYTFTARQGQRIRIEMSSTGSPVLDTFLYLFGPDGNVIALNDDIQFGVQTNSRIPVSGFLTLPTTGVYTIAATSFDNAASGSYTVRLSDNSATNTVSLSSTAYAVSEGTGGGGLGVDGTGFRVITVTRSGDQSGTATVDYATADGTASKQKDYTQALGTLVFGQGETSKSFTVFVDDDAFAEAAETVGITLSNPVGTTLGTQAATLTINSNDGANGPSPVRAQSFDAGFFVRQQYLDFLSREPDASGFQFWQGNFNECAANDEPCKEVRRVNVSAAFFLSIEFQETGYFVYRTFKAAYGDANSPGVSGTVPVIRLNEFLPDTQRIGQGVVVNVGNWQQQLEANKNAYALEFVLRPRFLAAFPLTMTSAQFVDKLSTNVGGGIDRDTLIAQLNSNPNVAAARAAVLRTVVENQQLRDNEFRRAFVLMQYYGYLRRNPDDPQDTNFAGWKFWLDKLNEFNGNFQNAEMVKAFLTSDEYIDRFGTRP